MDKGVEARKQNMRVYKIYRSISLDLIFYYAIEVLFLTQVKNIDISNVVLSLSFYAIFMVIMQIPASIVIDKLGTKKCTILGNIFNFIFILLIIFCDGLEMLIFAQFISSICFSLKEISDNALIHYSIPQTKKEGEIYSKIEGSAHKNYYIINAISATISGFLYVINPYIPLIGSLVFSAISIILSFAFYDIEPEKIKLEKKNYCKDFIQGVKFIINSQRLRSLFLYSGVVWGVICLISTYRTSLLLEINTPEQLITMILGIMEIASAFGAQRQLQFHSYFKNKSLSIILYAITFSILLIGLVATFNIFYAISLAIIIFAYMVIYFGKGIYIVLISRYLGNFMNENILTQIYAVNAMSRNLFRALIGFIGSYLLNITNTSNSMILVGIILTVAVLGLTSYMSTRVGLKPEQYNKKEICQK